MATGVYRWAAGLALAIAAVPAGATAQPTALVLGATGPSAPRFTVGAKLALGQRLALGAGDTLLILERGRTRRLMGPLAAYSATSVNRTTTLGLLAEVAQSSSLKVRELEARRAGDVRRGKTRGLGGPTFDVVPLTAKPFDADVAALIADPSQDALPLARIVPGETRHLCLLRDEPVFIARHPRDDGAAPVALTVTDLAAPGLRSETFALGVGEMVRMLPAAWQSVARLRVETSAEPGVGSGGSERVGQATLSRYELDMEAPEQVLSLYAGEECGQQAQQLYRVLKAELATP